jgi:hypothetical protein
MITAEYINSAEAAKIPIDRNGNNLPSIGPTYLLNSPKPRRKMGPRIDPNRLPYPPMMIIPRNQQA